jgi:malic enzyme
MEVAAVHAIAELAQAEQSEVVAAAYAGETLAFGPEYLIPKPFDPRLMMKIAPAVVQAVGAEAVPEPPGQKNPTGHWEPAEVVAPSAHPFPAVVEHPLQ